MLRYLLNILLLTAALCSISGCSTSTLKKENKKTVRTTPLSIPQIPPVIQDRHAAADYATLHFWDTLSPEDSVENGIMEQDIANFAAIAAVASPPVAQRAMTMLLQARNKNTHRIMELLELYLYEPESPVYSPDLMLAALHAADSLKMADTIRTPLLINELLLNAPGSKASNFPYIDSMGKKRSLVDPSTDQILIFYDPECDHCAQEMGLMAESPMLVESPYQITAIYPGGDFEKWKEHSYSLPSNWVIGMNPQKPIGTMDGWEIHTTPMIYVINRDGTIAWRGTSAQTLALFIDSPR